ncbi:hypothetical protein PCE1_002101 [Barthelona sp. PCE]
MSNENPFFLNEEYKAWKKNSSYIYDTVVTQCLDSISYTVSMLPDVTKMDEFIKYRCLLGTNQPSEDETNSLLLGELKIPRHDLEFDVTDYSSAMLPFNSTDKDAVSCFKIVQAIHVDSPVNVVRYCQQEASLIGVRTSKSGYLYDQKMFPSKPQENSKPTFTLGECVGDSWAFEFDTATSTKIATGSPLFDESPDTLLIYDISQESSNVIHPFYTIAMDSVVCDVSWHPMSSNIVSVALDDGGFQLIDVRDDKTAEHRCAAHLGGCNSIDWNCYAHHIIVTGGSDANCNAWDIRNPNKALHTFTGHTDEVYKVKWCPHNEALFASCAADRRVILWDPARIGMTQSEEDSNDGPPEMLFVHAGHINRVNDICWAPDSLMLASTAEDSLLEFWRPAANIFAAATLPNVTDKDLE